MAENTGENQEVKTCPKCKRPDLSKMSTREILRMALSFGDHRRAKAWKLPDNANQVNETLNM